MFNINQTLNLLMLIVKNCVYFASLNHLSSYYDKYRQKLIKDFLLHHFLNFEYLIIFFNVILLIIKHVKEIKIGFLFFNFHK